MATRDDLKKRVLMAIDTLPEDVLEEVATYVEHQQSRYGDSPPNEPPYKPVPLGGLWEGVRISDEDIRDVRREMWGGLGLPLITRDLAIQRAAIVPIVW